jgi:hypothetical protein
MKQTALPAIVASYDWDWRKAERHFLPGIESKPRYATAHEWCSEYLSRIGQHDKVVGVAQQALDLDPVSLRANSHLGLALYRGLEARRSVTNSA